MPKVQSPSLNASLKKKALKLKASSKKSKNPINLEKGLKSIENRILQKMAAKERKNSPSINYVGKLEPLKPNIAKVCSYDLSPLKKNSRYADVDSEEIRQAVAGSFRPNDADSIIRYVQN